MHVATERGAQEREALRRENQLITINCPFDGQFEEFLEKHLDAWREQTKLD